jgi:hypothetical protein
MSESGPCRCLNCKAIYPVVNQPGDSEVVVQCERCERLWYSIVYERMNFEGGKDTFEEYQIPITPDELARIKATPYEDLEYSFLVGRKARVFQEGEIVEVTSSFALSRCGRAF